jgi:amino acid adenylation domain-containing protein/non-ribosomal peptide synthase protein (TIGR01720 family)
VHEKGESQVGMNDIQNRIARLPPEKRALCEGLLRRGEGAARSGDAAAGSVPVAPDRDPVPSFAQERLWFLNELDPGSAAYNVVVPVELRGDLDVAALERALNGIVARHQNLRSRFRSRDGKLVLEFFDQLQLHVPVDEMLGLDDAARTAAIEDSFRNQCLEPFDLASGPLLRVRLLRFGDALHVLLFAFHHIVIDEWSFRVLFRELSQLYRADANDTAPRLEPLAIQYAGYAAWQREQLQGDTLDRLLAYWRGRLAGVESPELPLAQPRPARQTFDAGQVRRKLPCGLSDAVRAFARSRSASRTEPGEHSVLSAGQLRLLQLESSTNGGRANRSVIQLRISGPLDRDALVRAFEAIVRRHEILRTTFGNGEDGPMQVVHPAAGIAMAVDDLAGLSGAARESACEQAIAEEHARRFDLEHGPLLRCRLLVREAREHVLLLAMHHIVVDGWSLEVLFQELGTLYRGYCRGEAVELDALPVQYSDFALWQREWMNSEACAAQLGYWRDQLAGMQALQLPYDRAREAVQGFRGAQCTRTIDPEVSERLRALSRREGGTLFMTLLAGFVVLLHRYSQQTDVVVGTPIANRGHKELEGLIGFFVNTLVLRTDVSGDPTFVQLLGRVRETALRAYAHQDLPFEKLVDELQPERDLSRNPLFQVTFSLRGEVLDSLRLDGVQVTRAPVSAPVTHFDLDCHVVETGGALRVGFDYNVALFDAATIERMLDAYVHVLESVSISPQLRVGAEALLPRAERRLLLEQWTDTAYAHDADATLVSMFTRATLRGPQALALSYRAQALSYAELDLASNRMARRLRRLGVQPGTAVGVLMERSVDMVVAWLAVMKAGGAYLPLDPAYPPARLGYMLRDSGAPVLLTHAACKAEVADYAGERLYADGDWSGEDGAMLEWSVAPETAAYLIYTSGSTGEPKGVAVAHGALANLVQWHVREYAVSASDRATQLAGVSFDASVWEVWPYLSVGASVHIVEERLRQSPRELWQWLVGQAITLSFVPTPLAHAMLGESLPQGLSLRALLTGGDRLHAGQLPRRLPFRLVNHYGPTENAVVSSYAEVDLEAAREHLPPIGRPVDNVRAYVLDERLQPVPLGAVGELFVGGRSLARGYWGREALTAEKFLADPFAGEAGARLYRTGDLVRWRADGQLEFLGRIDSQVKIRGFRIELGEVEQALASHASVREAVVVVRDDMPGDRQLVGYVVHMPAVGALPTAAALRAHVRGRLPGHMVPHTIVQLEALPLTPNGKVDRDALRAPEGERQTDQAYVAPRTELERRIASIWCEVLRVKQVGAHDNFFELGGDSIMSMQIVARANRAGLGLSSKQIFQHQTVAELASVVNSAWITPASDIAVHGEVALTPIQAWFFDQPMPSRHHFNQSVLLQLRGPLDEAVLRRALGRLVTHHDALRARFVRDAKGWHQRVDGDETGEILGRFELPAQSDSDCQLRFQAIVSEVHRSLDLADGPMLRAALLEYAGEASPQLLIVVHHLVVDGVSWQVLIEDLEAVCRQLLAGDEPRLPGRTTSVQGFAAALARHAAGERVHQQLDHWLAAGEGCGGMLPRDRQASSPVNRWGDACSVEVQLTQHESQRLLTAAARRFRVRINDVLLTALALTLGEASGRSTIHVDLEGHGREDDLLGIDSTRTVGWFTAVYPVALSLPGGGIVETLATVKRQLANVPDAGLGYGCLRYLCPDAAVRDRLASTPMPEVGFNYRGRVDQALSDEALFRMLPGDAEAGIDPLVPRAHLIDVSGRVFDGRMTFRWFYSPSLHERATVERWAARFASHLRAIADASDRSEPGTQTLADFPLCELTPGQLQRLQQTNGQVRDIYPATPLQAGILFRALESSIPGVYLPQFIFELTGTLDVQKFERAWQLLVDRHDILRTAFAWVGLDRPLQVVRERSEVALACEDWRHIEADAEPAVLDDFLAEELARGIAPDTPPLLRLTLIRRDTSRWLLVWTAHHLILDGWCLPLILSEVSGHYRRLCSGEPDMQRPAPVFRDYIEWLQRVDLSCARQFWTRYLEGACQAIDLGIGCPLEAGDGPSHAEVRHGLSELLTGRVQRLARDARVTLNTVMQGAWALLLNRYSGERDVIFGVTVSGRAADVPGIESMLGLFINGLPVRVDVSGDAALLPWLAALQSGQAEARQYEATSLLQIQEWLGRTGNGPLFETVVVFENYPMQGVFDRDADGLQMRYSSSRGWTDVPIEVVVIPGKRLCIRIKYDQRRFDREEIEQVLGHYVALLSSMALEPSRVLSAYSMSTAVVDQ